MDILPLYSLLLSIFEKGTVMSPRILVAYASVHGSTAGVAEAIGKALQIEGYSVDIAPMKTVSSPGDYDSIVIGAPVYMGKVVGDVKKFVVKHRDALARVPVAAFCIGVAPLGKDPGDVDTIMNIFRTALAPLEPVDVTMFAGKIDMEKLPFMHKWIWKKMDGPVGDFRDWEAIGVWARELPRKLGISAEP
ncbi:MAG: protoporphyrinogen oxidase [Methanoregulaceae archaeon PtaB.Bin056]|nr:MAG: protoporphyrinogen oxidase [Methanoregulaceae archaeon PtaB.Bin056]